MAIYHLSAQIISRATKDGKLRSAISCAAYRSGEKLFDERSGEIKLYSRNIKPTTKIIAPSNAPEWVYNRELLWNEVEKSEKQYNAQLAREFNIALPIELNEKEQDKLAYDFCEKAFVEKGMIADICIHRDHKENPHFHVMLTMRRIGEDGKFEPKVEKQYLCRNGNEEKYFSAKELKENSEWEKIYKCKSGNIIKNLTASELKKAENKDFIKISKYPLDRKIDKCKDWNENTNLNIWRKQWEVMTNQVLKDNGINARITCESNQTLGNEKIATIHEGYVARNMEGKGKVSDRINQNKLIKEYNDNLIELRKYKTQKQEIEKSEELKRYFSPNEKGVLRDIAKELKMFVNYENVSNRLEQLKRWEKSLEFKEDSTDKIGKLNRISKEEELLNAAVDVLNKESTRFIEKNYPDIDTSILDLDEKIEIVNKSIDSKKILNSNEIDEIKDRVREENLIGSIKDIFRNNIRFTMSIKSDISNLDRMFNELVDKYNIDFSKPETARNVPEKVLNNMEKMINKKEELRNALNLIDKIYDENLEKMYPSWEGRLNLKMEEKELFIMSKEYFGKTLLPEDFKDTPSKYNTMQQREILGLLDAKNYDLMSEKYPEFKFSEEYKYMFYIECYSNKELSDMDKIVVNEYFSQDNYMKNFKVFDTHIVNRTGLSRNGTNTMSENNNSLIMKIISNMINEVDKRVQENEFEKNRLKKKLQKKKKRSQDMSL